MQNLRLAELFCSRHLLHQDELRISRRRQQEIVNFRRNFFYGDSGTISGPIAASEQMFRPRFLRPRFDGRRRENIGFNDQTLNPEKCFSVFRISSETSDCLKMLKLLKLWKANMTYSARLYKSSVNYRKYSIEAVNNSFYRPLTSYTGSQPLPTLHFHQLSRTAALSKTSVLVTQALVDEQQVTFVPLLV